MINTCHATPYVAEYEKKPQQGERLMVSLGGKYLFNDDRFEITIKDIARHLGRVVRFGGSVEGYWSVLQHSLLVSDLMELNSPRDSHARDRLSLMALFHDAHEFITGDVPTPWKYPELTRRQDEIDCLIAHAIGLPKWTADEHGCVSLADALALKIEAHFLAPMIARMLPDKFGPFAAAVQFGANVRYYYDEHHPERDWHGCWDENGAYVQMFIRRATDQLERLNSSKPVQS